MELIEEKGHDRQGGQNDFKKALEDVENSEREREARKVKGKKKDGIETPVDSVLDLDLVKADPDKLYPLIYYALKRRLKEWEEAMEERPGKFIPSSFAFAFSFIFLEEIKRTTQGKLAAATQVQSAEYLKPLFKSLRSRVCFFGPSLIISVLTFLAEFTFGYVGSYR